MTAGPGGARPVAALAASVRAFGPDAARRKRELLDAIDRAPRLSARELAVLHDALCFLRAYPDDPALLERTVEAAGGLRGRLGDRADALADTGFPGSWQCHEYAYDTLARLVRLRPGSLEIAWDQYEERAPLHHALVLVLPPAEVCGLDDISLTFEEWCERAKPPGTTDLGFVLGLFARSHLSPADRAYVYDSCRIPVRYALDRPGSGRVELAVPVRRVRYQRRPFARDRAPLARTVRRPLRVRRAPRDMLDTAYLALAARNLEILTLLSAEPDDAVVADCGRGLAIVLAGAAADQRDPLETTCFALFLKNGVPIAYGPASACLGCSEQGVNLFPEYRGSEMRHILGQFLRVLHHVLGARHFHLTRYAMGEGNPAALRTGAFWFYRKLGFRALDPGVEALAQEEEARMRADPAHRSDAATLRRLSHTEASFDLSGGACPRYDFAGIGLRASRLAASSCGGDRRRAEARWTARAARALGIADRRAWTADERRALRVLAPILAMIPDLARWTAREKSALVRLVRAKGGRSELATDRMMQGHRRFRDALRALVQRPAP